MMNEHSEFRAAPALPSLRRWGLLVLAALLTMVSTTSRAEDEYGQERGRGFNDRQVNMVPAQPGVALTAGEPTQPKKLTAKDVIALWAPQLKTAQDYGQMGAAPEQSPNVAAYSFRIIGPTIEELWNHYAQLCGMK
jgi:hypothetical protein